MTEVMALLYAFSKRKLLFFARKQLSMAQKVRAFQKKFYQLNFYNFWTFPLLFDCVGYSLWFLENVFRVIWRKKNKIKQNRKSIFQTINVTEDLIQFPKEFSLFPKVWSSKKRVQIFQLTIPFLYMRRVFI